MTKYGDLKVGHEFTYGDGEYSLRHGRQRDVVLETGISTAPLADDAEVTVINSHVQLSDRPTQVEIAALLILKMYPGKNLLLQAYVYALLKNPDEERSIDAFVAQSPEHWAKIDEWGYIGPKAWSLDEPSTFKAIWGLKPKGVAVTGEEEFRAVLDRDVLQLASAVADYRANGRPDEQTDFVYHAGTPLMAVQSSLADQIALFVANHMSAQHDWYNGEW